MSLQILPASGLEGKEELLERLVKNIRASYSKLFVTTAYIAIVDAVGTFHYLDTRAFDEHLYFIQNYVKDNFTLMTVGDCTIPFGGISLAFFKVSPKAIIVLYAPKGPSGQLLGFKIKMHEWAEQIDELIGDLDTQPKTPSLQQSCPKDLETVPTPSVPPMEKKVDSIKQVPLLIRPLSSKEKFPLEDTQVLQYCDGTSSIAEICALTNFPLLKVELIVRQYQKKNWLKILRTV